MEDTVLLSVNEGIATITLNRPKRHNAINQALLIELYNHIEEVTNNDSIRVAVLTGNGKSFCSGVDLEAVKTENLFDPRGDGTDLPDLFAACDKPIIAAVNGNAITGGFEMALNCDFMIASEKAAFADTHVKVGIHPGWGLTQILQENVNQRRAKQISLTGQMIGAHRAFEWGLVNEIVPHEQLIPRTLQIAADIAGIDPNMLKTVKKLIENRDTSTLQESKEHERKEFKKFLASMCP